MVLRTILVSMFALSLAGPTWAQPLSLRLSEQAAEQPMKLDISGSYEPSPIPIIFRDAAFGALAGGALGAGIGLASNDSKWGRDLAIGAGVGFLVGMVIGGFDAAYSGPRISVHADADGPVNPPSAGGPTMRLGQHF